LNLRTAVGGLRLKPFEEHYMTLKTLSSTIAALLLICASATAFAQVGEGPPPARGGRGGGGGGPGGQAARPPTAEEIAQLPVERRTPAEQQTALAKNPNWKAPRTSWGHPSLEGIYSTDDMRGIPRDRPQALGTQESLPQEQFLARAVQQNTGRTRAATTETFLRNEWGTRTFGFNSLIVDPPDGRQPPINDAGRARQQASAGRGTFANDRFDSFDDFSLYDRCIGRGISNGMNAAIYGNGIRIAQSPEAVSITYEMIHETRVILLDNKKPYPEIAQFTGNARGHWEGDTLVVESRGFQDRTSVGGAPNSANMRTTERIRRVDPEMIEYRITINDPDTYTAPFTVRTMWTTQPGYYPYEYSCHEGNFAVGGGLAGERALDREREAAIKAGKPLPERSRANIYGRPEEGAEIFDINAGE
jgi:hypothetical protein